MRCYYPLHDPGRGPASRPVHQLAAPAVVEMAAIAGFDFIVIDNERPDRAGEAEGMIRAAERARIAPLVRLDSPSLALRFLDLGATGDPASVSRRRAARGRCGAVSPAGATGSGAKHACGGVRRANENQRLSRRRKRVAAHNDHD